MADSFDVVNSLMDVDPNFVNLCDVLFGDALEPADVWQFMYAPDGVSKMMPATSDVHVPSAPPMRQVGRLVRRDAVKQRKVEKGLFGGKKREEPQPQRIGFPTPKKPLKQEIWYLPDGSSIIGEPGALATKKSNTHYVDIGNGLYTYVMDARGRKIPLKPTGARKKTVRKDGSESIVWAGEFSKMDDDKRQVFGWASVVEVNGEPVIDRQGDLITPDELEKAAYKYVEASRKGGHQHRRDGDAPFHASNMIESFVITPEKIEKMGLPSSTPCGWWVGYKVHDDDTWVKIKKGEVTGFSIHGAGKRREA